MSSLREQGPITTGFSLAKIAVVHSRPIPEITRYGSRLGARFARLAGTTEGGRRRPPTHISLPAARFASGSCIQHRPRKRRGRGEHRVPLHPQSRVQQNAQRTHTSSQQVQPNTSGIPRAMLDDLSRALLGVPGVLVTVACNHLAGLTPASGCRDHAVLSNASRALRPCASTASIATRLTFGNDWPNVPVGEAGCPWIWHHF